MIWLLIIPAGVIVYAWIVYPALLALLAAWRTTAATPEPASPVGVQAGWVAVILSAYNEEKVIARRIRNLIETCRPSAGTPRVRVLVGIDGATDRTAELARLSAEGHSFMEVVEFRQRRGKVAVLKDLAGTVIRQEEPREGILVFTDANTNFLPGSFEKLLEALNNERAGGASGRLIFRRSLEASGSAEPFYWDMETRMKTWESALDSCLGANGAIYAVRSNLFWRDIPSDTIVDDFVIGMKVREQGWRMVYVPEAVAEEDLPAERAEWRRRVRIGAGDFQALLLCRRCLNPAMGLFAWFFLSHKVLRWLTPVLLVWLLAISCVCAASDGSAARIAGRAAMAGFALWFALAAGASPAAAGTGRPAAFLRLLRHAAMMQAAVLVGFVKFATRQAGGAWEPTPRASNPPRSEKP